jgi:hypothetical protein
LRYDELMSNLICGKEEPEDSQSNRAGAVEYPRALVGQADFSRRALYGFFLLALPLAAQPMSSRFYSVGATFQTYSHPELTGWAAVALPLDQARQNWSFSAYSVVPSAKPFRIRTATTTGFATQIKVLGPCRVFALAMGGFVTDGQNSSATGSVGPLGVCPLNHRATWQVLGAYLRTKTNLPGQDPPSYWLGIGRSF